MPPEPGGEGRAHERGWLLQTPRKLGGLTPLVIGMFHVIRSASNRFEMPLDTIPFRRRYRMRSKLTTLFLCLAATAWSADDQGGSGIVVHGAGCDAVSAKRIDATTRETRFLQGAKEVGTVRASLTKDGKAMNTPVQGVDAQGKPVNANLVSERQ